MQYPGSLKTALFLIVMACFSGLKGQGIPDRESDMSLDHFREIALAEKDSVWVVDFWASWCRPCIMSIPHLKEVHADMQDKPVKFISVSWDEDPRAWNHAVTRTGMTWDQILVPDVRADHPFLDKHFPHTGIPAVFVISPKGKVKKVRDVYGLEKAIGKALK